MAKPGDSNWDVLNVGYGVLNPTGDTITGKVYDSDNSGFFSMVRQATVANFSPTNLPSGPLVGIVLRNEGKMSLTGPVDPTSWAHRYSQLVENRSDLELIQLRVRIPEIHCHLPVPLDLPPKEDKSPSHAVTNMYPVFIGQFDSIDAGREPVHGSLVWVDFQNRNTLQGPIYLGAVESNKTYLPSVTLEMSNKFANACNRALNEAVEVPNENTPVGKNAGVTSPPGPVVNSGGTPSTISKLAKAGSAIAYNLFPTAAALAIGATAASKTKAAKKVVASVKSAANEALKIYCQNIEQLRGELQNVTNRYTNVPFPTGTQVCNDEETRIAVLAGVAKIVQRGWWKRNFEKQTGESEAQRIKNAMIVYDTFIGNGFTPQASMAALAHSQGESGYFGAIVGGISPRAKDGGKDELGRGADKGFFQLNNVYGLGSGTSSKKLQESACIDDASGENYYEIIGKGKRAEINPNIAGRNINKKSAMPKELWDDNKYYDAGNPKINAMVLVAHLKNNSGRNNRLGTLAALMKNRDATSAQVHALFRNSGMAAGTNGKKNQWLLKKRMDTGEKVFGECYTGEGYVQNFKPGTTNKPY